MIQVSISKKLFGSTGQSALDVDFDLEGAETLALMGSSGEGKTTILQMLAGLLQPDSGSIQVDGKYWFHKEKGIHLPPQKRDIGFLFQEYSLFPNMTVLQNLRFALPKNAPEERVEEMLTFIGLEQLKDRKPQQLSGGQQQRVALARAMIRRPRLLLLDEPLSALDLPMRRKLQDDLKHLQEKYPTCTLLVSHDAAEVLRLADRVARLEGHRIQAQGMPAELLIPSKSLTKGQKGSVLRWEKSTKTLDVLIENQVYSLTLNEAQNNPWKVGEEVLVEQIIGIVQKSFED